MAEKSIKTLKHKNFLIILKYSGHLLAILYIIYTLAAFADLDLLILGHLTHVSIVPWLFMLFSSFIFRFCYVHRLPLYYIGINELITSIDYYYGIPINELHLLLLHLVLIAILIIGYSFYHIKCKIRNAIH